MPIRVYIIDEHPAVRMNLVRRLSAAEGILVVGDSGEARVALDELRSLHPDVVLIEVKMKRADGVGVCAQAACLDNRMKIVVSTIYADTEERRRAHKAGAVDYLTKDLDTPRLVERLRALVEREHRSNGDLAAGGPAEEGRTRPVAKEGSGEDSRP
jgi:DNA-binding NarL/FixJ family response regulator